MALTVRQNGSVVGGQPNTASASWWNDYHDLLTGAMNDQPVTFKTTGIQIKALGGILGAPTATAATGTGLGIGAYQYRVTCLDTNGGETLQGAAATVTTTTGNQKVSLTAIPLGPTGTASRNIYRTAVGGSTFFLLATLADNTTTTFSDTTADGSLGAQTPPLHPFFGGLGILDSGGAVKTTFYTDGAAYFYHLLSIGVNLSGLAAVSINTDGTVYLGGQLTNSGVLETYQAGSANGFTFKSWSGSAGVTPFSIGGQFNSALSWVDTSGNLNLFGTLQSANGSQEILSQQSGSQNGAVFQTWSGTAAVTPFSIGGQFSSALAYVDKSGNFNGPIAGGIPTTRNGAALSVPIYTGTTTPVNPPTGSIWIKA